MKSDVLIFLCGQVLTPDDQNNESSHTGNNKAVANSWGSMSKKGAAKLISADQIKRG